MKAKEVGEMLLEYDFSNKKGIRGKYQQNPASEQTGLYKYKTT